MGEQITEVQPGFEIIEEESTDENEVEQKGVQNPWQTSAYQRLPKQVRRSQEEAASP